MSALVPCSVLFFAELSFGLSAFAHQTFCAPAFADDLNTRIVANHTSINMSKAHKSHLIQLYHVLWLNLQPADFLRLRLSHHLLPRVKESVKVRFIDYPAFPEDRIGQEALTDQTSDEERFAAEIGCRCGDGETLRGKIKRRIGRF